MANDLLIQTVAKKCQYGGVRSIVRKTCPGFPRFKLADQECASKGNPEAVARSDASGGPPPDHAHDQQNGKELQENTQAHELLRAVRAAAPKHVDETKE